MRWLNWRSMVQAEVNPTAAATPPPHRQYDQFKIGHGIHAEYPFLHVDWTEGVATVISNGETLLKLRRDVST